MQLYKVRQRLGAAPPDPHVLDLQPIETPFKKSWVRPYIHFQSLTPLEEVNQSHINTDSQLLMKHQMVLRPRWKVINSMETARMPQVVQNITTKQNYPFHHALAIYYLGKLNHKCIHCGSLNFMNEMFRCCHNGKVHLENLYPYPEELKSLLVGRHTISINFQ